MKFRGLGGDQCATRPMLARMRQKNSPRRHLKASSLTSVSPMSSEKCHQCPWRERWFVFQKTRSDADEVGDRKLAEL